jgi:hypothetical protein
MMVAAPAFADILPPGLNPLGLDLDPFHIFSPAPAPEAPAAPMMHHHHHHHHMMMHHKKMMMMHKHKMMMHKKMMKKM